MAHLYKRRKKFWICYYVNGQRIQKSLKTDNERIAKEKKIKIEYELSFGDLYEASSIPLAVVLEEFCHHLKATRTYKSFKNDISRLRSFFGPVCECLKLGYPTIGKKPVNCSRHLKDKYVNAHVKADFVEDITAEVINRFLSERIERNRWAPKTANLMRQILHKFFEYAIKYHGFCSRDRRYPNPVGCVERFREPAPEIRFLSLEEIDQQLKLLEKHPVIYVITAVYIFAGLRREEALWLTCDDVDLDSRLIRVQAKTVNGEYWQPKTKRNRVIPISNALYKILSGYNSPKNCTWFFPSPNGKRWDPDNFSQDLRKINNANGLVWNCHYFRHTFGSHLAQKGESLYKIAELLGNSPDICRRHYAALMPERMRDTVEFEKDMLISGTNTANIETMLRQILDRVSKEEVQHKPKPSVEPLCP